MVVATEKEIRHQPPRGGMENAVKRETIESLISFPAAKREKGFPWHQHNRVPNYPSGPGQEDWYTLSPGTAFLIAVKHLSS
jgi:hypothetical protein